MILFFRGLRDYPAALEKTSVCMFWKRVLFTLLIACLIAQPIISGGARPCLESSFDLDLCKVCGYGDFLVWQDRKTAFTGQKNPSEAEGDNV